MSKPPRPSSSLSSTPTTPAPPRHVPGTWAAPPSWARVPAVAPSTTPAAHLNGSAPAKKPRKYARTSEEDALTDRAAKR